MAALRRDRLPDVPTSVFVCFCLFVCLLASTLTQQYDHRVRLARAARVVFCLVFFTCVFSWKTSRCCFFFFAFDSVVHLMMTNSWRPPICTLFKHCRRAKTKKKKRRFKWNKQKKKAVFFGSSLTVYIHVENLNMTVCSVLFSLLVCLWIVATHTHTHKKRLSIKSWHETFVVICGVSKPERPPTIHAETSTMDE